MEATAGACERAALRPHPVYSAWVLDQRRLDQRRLNQRSLSLFGTKSHRDRNEWWPWPWRAWYRKSKETLAAEKAQREAWLAPRRAEEQRARELRGDNSSSATAELEADGIACMGEQSRDERDAEGRAQAFDVEDSDSENDAIGGGVAASQPVWGSQHDDSPLELSDLGEE